jgi:serine/threonine-protein kinase
MRRADFQIPMVLQLTAHRWVRVREKIGDGAVSAVFRGELHDDRNGETTPVALKVFPRIRAEGREATLQRLNEALGGASQVHHRNVVRVIAYSTRAPLPFAVFEFVEGESVQGILELRAQEGRMSTLAVGLYVTAQAARGLSAALSGVGSAPAARLIHGALNARSILVSHDGEVKVGDFGLSVALGVESGRVAVSELVRRMRYVAPEIACGQVPDGRADVFSLGVLLYELVCGPRIPSDCNAAQAMDFVKDGIVPVSLIEHQMPGPLRQILRRAVDRDPARRHPDVSAFAQELQRLCALMGFADTPRELGAETFPEFLDSANVIVCEGECVDGDEPTIIESIPLPLPRSVRRLPQ